MFISASMYHIWPLTLVGSLSIERSRESDEGNYECVAENDQGVAYSYAAALYVKGMSREMYLTTRNSLEVFNVNSESNTSDSLQTLQDMFM